VEHLDCLLLNNATVDFTEKKHCLGSSKFNKKCGVITNLCVVFEIFMLSNIVSPRMESGKVNKKWREVWVSERGR
jgi:hypothetical protein